MFDCEEVYSPAEDTLLLLSVALSEARPDDLVLEIGCGSGLVASELAPKVKRMIATDINPHAVRAALDRAESCGSVRPDFVRADLFSGIKGLFDLVLFNPPYLPTLPEERTGCWIDYALDGGRSGRDTIALFLSGLSEHLSGRGRALLLISSLTGLSSVMDLASSLCLSCEVVAEEGCFFERLYVLRIVAQGPGI